MTQTESSTLRKPGGAWTPERRAIASRTMAETNRKYASERMKRNNPMAKDDIREKMSRTLQQIHHHPKIQGGNGRGLTIPQKSLLDELTKRGLTPIPEYVIPTRMRPLGYPTHYKIDLALPELKIAIEIDGGSHGSLKVQEADRRKTAFLTGCGWHVLRFTNQQAEVHTEECALEILFTISK